MIIALDIDGTITDNTHQIPDDVVSYLHGIQKTNTATIMVVTGRAYSYAEKALHKLTFPYLLAIQNGADLLQMPSKKQLKRSYIDTRLIKEIENRLSKKKQELLIYGGLDTGDFCYYQRDKFSPFDLDFIDNYMIRVSPGKWRNIQNYNEISQGAVPLVKALGTLEELDKLLGIKGLSISNIKEPINGEFYMSLITNEHANKGRVILETKELLGLDGPIIVAGDDRNDLDMLNIADVKIVMETAPSSMHGLADILAKPSNDKGIIEALEEARRKVK